MMLAEHKTINPEEKVLNLLHRCAAEVPAYLRFLEAWSVNPAKITFYLAFRELPGKADCMQAYPLPERCHRVAVFSGSLFR
jgi:phenylacetate-coenzyme A ligase PaaK-like adenylate-forming protein